MDLDQKLHDLSVGEWDEQTMTYTVGNKGYGKDGVEVFKAKLEVKANVDDQDYGFDSEVVSLRGKSDVRSETTTLFGEINLVQATAGFSVNFKDSSIGAKVMITSVKGGVGAESEIFGDKYRLNLDGGVLGLGFEGELCVSKPKVKAGVYMGAGGSASIEQVCD